MKESLPIANLAKASGQRPSHPSSVETLVDPGRSRWSSREHTLNTGKERLQISEETSTQAHRVPDMAELKRPKGLGSSELRVTI